MPATLDLHIHSLLSPCGDLEMSPKAIIQHACSNGLNMIGITDHNSTRQAAIIREIGERCGIQVLTGVEVTSSEEVHALAYFNGDENLNEFQVFLDNHLPDVPNNPKLFGYQVAVNEQEEIIFTEERLLISALDVSLEEIEKEVHRLGGLFIPAHIDRPRFGLLGQLGLFPSGLQVDAIEVSGSCNLTELLRNHPELPHVAILHSSDSHTLDSIGKVNTILELSTVDFDSLQFYFINFKQVK